MLYRLILAPWARDKGIRPAVIEKDLSEEELLAFNQQGYHCYTILNHSSSFIPGQKTEEGKPVFLEGSDIDTFDYVFVDMDLKDNAYPSKEAFIDVVKHASILPSAIVDSGNGVHVYWKVTDLDAESFVRLQRRLCRQFNTDPTVSTVYRLMRVPGTFNVKVENDFKLCSVLDSSHVSYTCERLDKWLPPITVEDEAYAKQHINQTYNVNTDDLKITSELPKKFTRYLITNPEVKRLYYGPVRDRSKADYRLAHLLVVNGYSKEEILAILLNTEKALERAPIHQYNYAKNIIENIMSFEKSTLSETAMQSVSDLLKAMDQGKMAPRIFCHPMVDATHQGFRLSQVVGLVGGSGTGKTAIALNWIRWFAQYNPEYVHVVISLEQPALEIAQRWAKLCQNNRNALLDDKIHIISNTRSDGTARTFTFMELEEEIKAFEKRSGKKVGCVTIDHIEQVRKRNAEGQKVELVDMCQLMKTFAINTNTFLIMLSQTSRSKAGIGDIELDKDAAFGTTFFEANCDYLVTTWQPLSRVYDRAPHMTCNAIKYCKIRHKTVGKDHIQENQIYAMHFNPDTEEYTEFTSDQITAFNFYQSQATQLRGADKRREPAMVKPMAWLKEGNFGTTHSHSYQA